MAGSSSRPPSPLRQRLTGVDRPYAAILSGCLAFLFAAAWLQTPITGYQAGATLSLMAGNSTHARGGDRAERPAIERWFRAEGITASWTDGGGESGQLALNFVDRDERTALNRLQDVAQRFVGEYFQDRRRTAYEANLDEQRSLLADARLREEVLERNLESALADLQSAMSEAKARFQAEHRQPALAARSGNRAAPQPVLNPEWEELAARLARQKAERSRLLLKFTPSHPLTKAVEAQIGVSEAALAQAPQFLKNDLRGTGREDLTDVGEDQAPAAEDEMASADADPQGAAEGAEDFDVRPLALRVETLRKEFAAAREHRGQTELSLLETLREPSQAEWTASIVTPAAIVQVHGGKSTKFGLLAALGVSLLSALSVWTTHGLLVPERLETAAQVAGRVDLPLVSTVCASQPARPTSAEPGERCLWWLIRGCEAALLLIAVLTVATLIADSQLSQLFVADPLRAAGEVMTRWR